MVSTTTTRRTLPLALLVIAVLSVCFVADHELWTPDEPRDAEIARETGFRAIPTLNQEPFLEKPPLHAWAVSASYRAFGVSAWAARIPSVLFGWGTLAFTFLLARRMFGPEAAAYAILVLGTTLMFFNVTHHCLVDDALLFFSTGTVYWLHEGVRSASKRGPYLAAYAFALGVFLSKGLVGLALIAPAFVAFLLWTRRGGEILRARPWYALLIVGGGALLWLAALPPELRHVFLVHNQLGRFSGDVGDSGHLRPVYYYLPVAFYAFLPWTLALAPALVWAAGEGDQSEKRFLLSWLAVGLVVLSAAATKRELYLLPLLPAGAILVGGWFDRVREPRGWARGTLVTIAVAAVAAEVGVCAAAVGTRNWLGLGVALAAGAAALAAARRGTWPVRIALGVAAALVGAVFVVVPPVDAAKSLRPFCERLRGLDRIGAIKPDETTRAVIPFYSGRWVEGAPDAPHLVLMRKGRMEVEIPPGYTVTERFDPPPLEIFGRRVPLSDRGLVLVSRIGGGG